MYRKRPPSPIVADSEPFRTAIVHVRNGNDGSIYEQAQRRVLSRYQAQWRTRSPKQPNVFSP